MSITPSPLSPPMNHVLVDYENVHHLDREKVGNKPVSFVLLLGPKQTKVAAEVIDGLMAMAAAVNLVRITEPGKNAVDFALAYYLGQAVRADPAGYFHLVSKDKGYDPLIKHLRSRRVHVQRHESFETLTFALPGKVPAAPSVPTPKPAIPQAKRPQPQAKKAAARRPEPPVKKAEAGKVAEAPRKLSEEELLAKVKARLESNPKTLPARRKTLATKIGEVIDKPPGSAEVAAMIESAVAAGWLSFNGKDHPEYRFQAGGSDC